MAANTYGNNTQLPKFFQDVDLSAIEIQAFAEHQRKRTADVQDSFVKEVMAMAEAESKDNFDKATGLKQTAKAMGLRQAQQELEKFNEQVRTSANKMGKAAMKFAQDFGKAMHDNLMPHYNMHRGSSPALNAFLDNARVTVKLSLHIRARLVEIRVGDVFDPSEADKVVDRLGVSMHIGLSSCYVLTRVHDEVIISPRPEAVTEKILYVLVANGILSSHGEEHDKVKAALLQESHYALSELSKVSTWDF